MAFRADEEAVKGLEYAFSRLVPKDATKEERAKVRDTIIEIAEEYGPVVDGYPSWHPLVASEDTYGWPITLPCPESGYLGLDHTVYFANAFITCPYAGGSRTLSSLQERPQNNSDIVKITHRILDCVLYHANATPILVECSWERLNYDKTIPKNLAVALMLEKEIPQWRNAQVAETWETMRPYFLGAPHGARSSLFIDQDTGQAMKTVWNAIIKTGMYGPIKV